MCAEDEAVQAASATCAVAGISALTFSLYSGGQAQLNWAVKDDCEQLGWRDPGRPNDVPETLDAC